MGHIEQRKFARLDIALAVSYAVQKAGGDMSEMAEAMSSDISSGGIRLMTPSELDKGSLLSLEISLPNQETNPIQARGEVVWQQKISDYSYETGAVIKYMDDKDKARLMNFVFDQLSRIVAPAHFEGPPPKAVIH